MNIQGYVQGIDGKIKELTVINADGTATKFVPTTTEKKAVTEVKADSKTSKK